MKLPGNTRAVIMSRHVAGEQSPRQKLRSSFIGLGAALQGNRAPLGPTIDWRPCGDRDRKGVQVGAGTHDRLCGVCGRGAPAHAGSKDAAPPGPPRSRSWSRCSASALKQAAPASSSPPDRAAREGPPPRCPSAAPKRAVSAADLCFVHRNAVHRLRCNIPPVWHFSPDQAVPARERRHSPAATTKPRWYVPSPLPPLPLSGSLPPCALGSRLAWALHGPCMRAGHPAPAAPRPNRRRRR